MTVFAPASSVAERFGPWAERFRPRAGSVTPVDASCCVLETGSDKPQTLAVYLGILGVDFRVESPGELVTYLRELGSRYQRTVGSSAG